jgi:hypothetical protein
MPFQVDVNLIYHPNDLTHRRWSAFCKFDFPIQDDSGYAAQCVLAEGATVNDAFEGMTSTRAFQKYLKLAEDNEEGASQNAEGLVN